VTGGPEKYRQAEKVAKEKKLRIWKNYTPAASTISEKVSYYLLYGEILTRTKESKNFEKRRKNIEGRM
jgi:hypothetical protein